MRESSSPIEPVPRYSAWYRGFLPPLPQRETWQVALVCGSSRRAPFVRNIPGVSYRQTYC